MTFTPHLVALDIDGTIVDGNGHLPASVHEAIAKVVAANVPVVLATGRAWPATRPIFDALGLPHGWAVSSNGAVVVEYPPAIAHKTITFDPRETIERVSELAPNAIIGIEEFGVGWRLSAPFPDGELDGTPSYETLEELASRPVTRIVVREPGADEDEFTKLSSQLGLKEVTYFVGWSAWLDIAPIGIDKAFGLTYVAQQLGVEPSNVLALGDGRNDIDMLEWAGRGVALGDSPEDVKKAADHVTGMFADGGTAEELSRWF